MENSDKILALVNGIMDISEAEAGTLKLKIEEVRPKRMLLEVIDLYADVAEEKQIKIHFSCGDEDFLSVDIIQMRRALANLLDNAIKYNRPNGNIWISGKRENDHYFFSIEDDGIGIAPENLPKVFIRLFRAENSRSQSGLGLGLALVKAIVEAHNGKLNASSEINKGSKFVISL
jgi:signal transduction histidine kinase